MKTNLLQTELYKSAELYQDLYESLSDFQMDDIEPLEDAHLNIDLGVIFAMSRTLETIKDLIKAGKIIDMTVVLKAFSRQTLQHVYLNLRMYDLMDDYTRMKELLNYWKNNKFENYENLKQYILEHEDLFEITGEIIKMPFTQTEDKFYTDFIENEYLNLHPFNNLTELNENDDDFLFLLNSYLECIVIRHLSYILILNKKYLVGNRSLLDFINTPKNELKILPFMEKFLQSSVKKQYPNIYNLILKNLNK